jgi:hypothetical protein
MKTDKYVPALQKKCVTSIFTANLVEVENDITETLRGGKG